MRGLCLACDAQAAQSSMLINETAKKEKNFMMNLFLEVAAVT
jgi:hypothetical protein